jgi:hypothetical protein
MAKKRTRIDVSSPEAQALAAQIQRDTFVTEGRFVAFPTCFPGVTAPIPGDESRITALDVSAAGVVHGGTSGRRVHVLAGAFGGPTGLVFDLGVVEDAQECTAVCCGATRFVACVNGATGGRIVSGRVQGVPGDLLQEWGFGRGPIDDHGGVVEGEPILHAIAEASRQRAVGVSSSRLFVTEIETGATEIVGAVRGRGRLARGAAGAVFGFDEGDSLWRFDPGTGRLDRRAVALPGGRWDASAARWGRDPTSGLLYTGDADGQLFALAGAGEMRGPLGRVPLTPVGAMAVTLDGRLFGFCGAEMAKMFCFDPGTAAVRTLGVAVSVIERRRYGYVFGDAITGPGGELVFGENDDLGHLWLYFPTIRPATG